MDVIFRADASRHIGTGHLMRCLTLADALKARGARCRFVCRQVTASLTSAISSHGHELQLLNCDSMQPWRAGRGEVPQEDDAIRTVSAVGAEGADWLVVDHYGLGIAWERRMRTAAARILVIDDLADRPHECDLLLDQNFRLNGESRYAGRVPERCRLLLGPRYALLREEFVTRRPRVKPRTGSVRRVLVSFGGVDAANHTAVAVAALRWLAQPDVQVDVVIGAEHPNRSQIEPASAGERYTLHVQTTRMAELMAAADLCIGAGGSATWERCCLGLPAVVGAVAGNQVALVHDCALAGVLYAPAAAFGDPEELGRHIRALAGNELLRESLSRAGMAMVDGQGTSRVVRALGLVGVEMRPAVAADARSLFKWRNHPAVRAASRSREALDWAGHDRWLDAVLQDPARTLLIGEAAGRPIGVVRFDVEQGTAAVSIYMVPERDPAIRGADLLAAAESWLSQNRAEVRQLNAEVLGENSPSHGLFRGAGYRRHSTMYTKRVR